MSPKLPTYNVDLDINGHILQAKVVITWEYDIDVPDFDLGSKVENETELARFQNGELLCLVIKVTVNAEGEEGNDYLGQVFVAAHSINEDIGFCVDGHTMVVNAAEELRNIIIHKAKRLSKYLPILELTNLNNGGTT